MTLQENQKTSVKILKHIVSIISIVFPLTGIPQIMKIWVHKNAEGVSLLTWGSFLLFTIPLFLYSIVQKDKRLTIMWILWIIVYTAIVIGTIIYG